MDSESVPQPGNRSIWVVIGLVVVFPVVCCGSCTGAAWLAKGWFASEEAVAKENGGKKKPVDLTPEFKLTSEELAKEFVADFKVAKAKYDNGLKLKPGESTWPGRVVEVTGAVTSVGPTLDQFMLKGAKKKVDDPIEFGIRIGIEAEHGPRCARLSKGQKVKVVGKYFSLTEPYYLTLTECIVTELEKGTIIVISAEDLAKEFEKDAEAAKKKYEGQEAIVTGLVEDIRKAEGPQRAILKGTATTRVTTNVNSFMQLPVAKGQTLEFRAHFMFPEVKKGELDVLSKVTISAK